MIKVRKINNSYLHVECDSGIEMEIREKFQFEVPGWRFTPKGRAGIWDGKIYLYDIVRHRLPFGLFHHLQEFASEHDYELTADDLVCSKETYSINDAKEFMDGLRLHSRGKPVEYHDYQLRAFHIAMTDKRGIFHASVGAGKSMIIYSIARWLQSIGKRMLIVVPTISLTSQMKSDFADYACVDNDWSADDSCHIIKAGADKNTDKPIVISTFQSIYKLDAKWFNSFDCIFGDEGHKIQSATISNIYNLATDVEMKLACTGTLHDTKCHILAMQALTGKVHDIATTKTLIDRGVLSELKIKGIALTWNQEISKALTAKNVQYEDEINFIVTNEKRNKFITNLALQTPGVTLVVFRLRSQGEKLYEMIKSKSVSRDVHYVAGDVDGTDREDIRQSVFVNKSDDILVVSYGTYSTGVNLPNIENIILAHPMKSKITILQTVGRGLRLHEGKTNCTLYDIADNMTYKSRVNTTFQHYGERIKMYLREGFKMTMKNVDFQ
jgi:superfamily II DNA or RNA helicase